MSATPRSHETSLHRKTYRSCCLIKGDAGLRQQLSLTRQTATLGSPTTHLSNLTLYIHSTQCFVGSEPLFIEQQRQGACQKFLTQEKGVVQSWKTSQICLRKHECFCNALKCVCLHRVFQNLRSSTLPREVRTLVWLYLGGCDPMRVTPVFRASTCRANLKGGRVQKSTFA